MPRAPRCAALLLAALSAGAGAASPSLIGESAPDFALKGLDGRNVRLSEFRGQVVLVNFWARWSGEAREELPALERIESTYARAGLIVLGVSVDEDVARAREFAAHARLSYPILFDTGAGLGEQYRLERMPVTLLIDRFGVIRFASVGYRRGDERIYLDKLRQLLRE